MDIVLQQQSEELSRSRSDYSALFLNFKQSRVIYEEREATSRAELQRALNDNKALESTVRQLAGELKLCRSEFTELMKNFEVAKFVSDQQEESNKRQLLLMTNQYEASRRKSQEQRDRIRELKNSQRLFESDLIKIEKATKLHEVRERTITEKYDVATELILNLRGDIEEKADLITEQLADIEKLHHIITYESMPKSAYDRVFQENKELKIKIKEEMIDLEIHQHLKQKYADLQIWIEKKTVAIEEYKSILSQFETSKAVCEIGSTTDRDHAALQEKYQKSIDEKYAIIEAVKILQDAKISILRALSESEDKSRLLESQLEKSTAELSAMQAREQLRIEMLAVEDDHRQSVERSIVTQRNAMTMDSIRKEREAIEQLQESIMKMEKEMDDLKLQTKDKMEYLTGNHAVKMEEQNTAHRICIEEEKAHSLELIKELKQQHSEESELVHERHKQQITALSHERDEATAKIELQCQNHIDLAEKNHQKLYSSLVQKHVRDIEEIKSAVIADGDRMLMNSEKSEERNFREEILDLENRLKEREEDCKHEKARVDHCTAELLRIESEYSKALESAQRAYQSEVSQRGEVIADNTKWRENVDRGERKIRDYEEIVRVMKTQQINMQTENSLLQDIALNFERDSESLRCQLEDVKDAVMERMSATLDHTSAPIAFSPSITKVDPTSTSYTPTGNSPQIIVVPNIPMGDAHLTLLSHLKPTKCTAKQVRSKLIDDHARGSHNATVTPIQAAINRKHAAAAAFSSTANSTSTATSTATSSKIGNNRIIVKDPLPSHIVSKYKKKGGNEVPSSMRNGGTTKGQRTPDPVITVIPTSIKLDSNVDYSIPSTSFREAMGGSYDGVDRGRDRGQNGDGGHLLNDTDTPKFEGHLPRPPSGRLIENALSSDSSGPGSNSVSHTHVWGTGAGLSTLYSPITPASTWKPSISPPSNSTSSMYSNSLPTPSSAIHTSLPPPVTSMTSTHARTLLPTSPFSSHPLELNGHPPLSLAHTSSLELMDRLINSAKMQSPLLRKNMLSAGVI